MKQIVVLVLGGRLQRVRQAADNLVFWSERGGDVDGNNVERSLDDKMLDALQLGHGVGAARREIGHVLGVEKHIVVLALDNDLDIQLHANLDAADLLVDLLAPVVANHLFRIEDDDLLVAPQAHAHVKEDFLETVAAEIDRNAAVAGLIEMRDEHFDANLGANREWLLNDVDPFSEHRTHFYWSPNALDLFENFRGEVRFGVIDEWLANARVGEFCFRQGSQGRTHSGQRRKGSSQLDGARNGWLRGRHRFWLHLWFSLGAKRGAHAVSKLELRIQVGRRRWSYLVVDGRVDARALKHEDYDEHELQPDDAKPRPAHDCERIGQRP